MAVIKCPHCGNYISSSMTHCTECGKEIVVECEKEAGEPTESEVPAQEEATANHEPAAPAKRPWYHLSARRIVVLCFLAPFILGGTYLIIADIQRAKALEERAYQRVMESTDLLVYEDFIVRFPDSKYVEDVKQSYEKMKVEHSMFFAEAANGGREQLMAFIEAHPSSPYRKLCENRIDSIDWDMAVEMNTLESYQTYLAQHPQGLFLADATDAYNHQMRLVVTPEETSILRGAVENFLSAMTAGDAIRIDELTHGTINFCGMTESTGANVVEYYKQNIHKSDVLGVHFQLGGTSINKRNANGSDSFNYNLYSTATATINRSAVDSAMVVNYRVSATFSPERRITGVSLNQVVEAVE